MDYYNQKGYGSQETGSWRCPECETINIGDRCYVCGQPRKIDVVPEKKIACRHCGYQNSTDARYCSKCGKDLTKAPERNWKKIVIGAAAAAILAILFLPGNKTEPPKPTEAPVAAHVHSWSIATCTDPRICSSCGETSGSALGHTWKNATCEEPMICRTCGTASGTVAGHNWVGNTCQVCGKIKEGQERPTESTQAKSGEFIDYMPGDWEKVRLKDGSSTLNVWAYAFMMEMERCESMTINIDVTMNAGTSCKNWQLWGRINGKFKKLGEIDLPGGNGSTSEQFYFAEPITLDAVVVTPTIAGGYSWSMGLSVTDIYLAE